MFLEKKKNIKEKETCSDPKVAAGKLEPFWSDHLHLQEAPAAHKKLKLLSNNSSELKIKNVSTARQARRRTSAGKPVEMLVLQTGR